MKRSIKRLAFVLVPLLVLSVLSIAALAESQPPPVTAALSGYQEIPAYNTTGRGLITIQVLPGPVITYTLAYNNLVGTTTAAHLHFAQRGVTGGVVAYLCGGGGKPACPPGGTVQGQIVAADIQAVPSQGISAGDINAVVNALAAGVIYANVHSTTFSGGEIRGQIGR
jgi:hypothetical protein